MDHKVPLLPKRNRRWSFDSPQSPISSASLDSRPCDGIMSWCCLIPFSGTKDGPRRKNGQGSPEFFEKNEPGLEEVMKYVGSDNSIDLLSDEGSSFQDDQWRLVLRDKILVSREGTFSFHDDLAETATFESALEELTRTYTSHGLTKCVPHIQDILKTVQPFATAITTIVQASPTVACLVWGSVQLVLGTLVRFAAIFDEIGEMLREITKDLPRFHAYMEVLHTPRLHQALREVYDLFIMFNFKVIDFLRTNKCVLMAKIQWTMIDKDFQITRRQLHNARSTFEREVRLANVQTQNERHLEVLRQISKISTSTTTSGETVTNIMPPRNPMFEGRVDELFQLHSSLESSFALETGRTQCSCVIHGVGGMGKTQIVLEYTYRYRSCYKYIFWIHAESNTTLSDSFLSAIRRLPISLDGLSPALQRQVGLEWLQSSANPWLMVFDNLERAQMITPYWPSGNLGAVIVTTQNPDLKFMATSNIHLQPMSPTEGSALIQRYLHRGGSERVAAEQLSRDLGGLPLAITHFAGYVAKSQCTIDQISKFYRNRAKSSQIWTAESVAASSMYAQTLATVWDLAWRRLSEDSQLLLEMIAFLDPDMMPEDMWVGSTEDAESHGWQYWDRHRFNNAVTELRDRHLVERDFNPSGPSLRTHRALQRTVLHKLDGEVKRRKHIFEEVIGMVRRSFPEANLARRGDLSQIGRSGKYISQVISIHIAYTGSDPKIKGDLTFLTVLRDSACFLVNNGYQVDGIPLAESGMDLGLALLDPKRSDVFFTMLDCMSSLGVFYEWLGIKGRQRSVDLSAHALDLVRKHFAGIPNERWTDLDKIRYGRAYHNYGFKITHFNRVEEASSVLEKAINYYSKVKDQESIKSWIANVISFEAIINASKQHAKKATQLAQDSIDKLADVLGQENPLTLQAKGGEAMITFTIGKIGLAAHLYEELTKVRVRIGGKSAHDTLACQYNLAVCYQNLNRLKDAEAMLRLVLENSCIDLQWRSEDVARTKFRLSIVLRVMKRPEEARQWREEALTARKEWEDQFEGWNPNKEFSDEDDMKLFDDGVIIHHGRTTGIWSDGKHW